MSKHPAAPRSPRAHALPLLCAALLLVGGALAPSPAAAGVSRADAEKLKRPGESDDVAAARLNEEGKALVRQRELHKALERFQAALQLFPISNAIFNVGSMLYALKQYEEAFPYLEETLRAPLSPEQREVVLRYRTDVLDKLKLSHKDLLVQTNPPGAKISLNGKELPFPAPQRVLVPFGSADLTLTFPGYKAKAVVIESTPDKPAKDVLARLEREEPEAVATVHCPKGADVFVDSQMRGFDMVRARLRAGEHVVRCGKTKGSAAFERTIVVRVGQANSFDFSLERE
jgi:tetratricopeptide (TPR) repeat protein